MRARPCCAGRREQYVAEFRTTVQGLLALRDWLRAHRVTQVAMESWPLGERCLRKLLHGSVGCDSVLTGSGEDPSKRLRYLAHLLQRELRLVAIRP